MPKLVVISGKLKNQTFELTADKVSVGRLPDNMICLEDESISGRHAELRREGDDYTVRDLNSTNGTCVNGRRVAEARLYHSNLLQFGQVQAQYHYSTQAPSHQSPFTPGRVIDLSDTSISSTPVPLCEDPASAEPPRRSKLTMAVQISMLVLGLLVIALLVLILLKFGRL